MEVNSNHDCGGNNNIVPAAHPGQTLIYLTPGMVLGRFNLRRRLAFSAGGGFEIAATSFHSAHQIPILSIRFPF